MPKTNSKLITKKTPVKARNKVVVRSNIPGRSLNVKRYAVVLVLIFAIIGTIILSLSQAADLTKVSVSIPTSSYAIPSNSIYVKPTGSDGATGTQDAPLKTLKAAVTKAPAGSTIVMMEGVYRETVGTVTKPLTIQAYPSSQVWLDGSDEVTGWIQDGSVWRKDGWTASAQLCPKTTIPAGEIDPDQAKYYSCYTEEMQQVVDPINPLSFLPDMVFVGGAEQRQVRTRKEVVDGTFYVDQATSRLYLGTNPGGKLVEASTRQVAIQYYKAGVAGSKLRGIGIRRFASKLTFSSKPGQVEVSNGAKGIEFDKMLFTESAANGLFLTGSASDRSTGLTIKDSVFANNGASGISGNYTDGLIMKNNTVYNNNTQKAQWEGTYGSFAGTKIARMTNSTIENNLFQDNYGTGFWCDLDCKDNKIIGNMSRGNFINGIYYEISYGGLIASNVTYNNGQAGIKASGQGIKIYNNTSYNNTSENIFIYDDPGLDRISSSEIQVKNNIIAGGPRSIANRQLIRAWMGRTDINQTVRALDNNLYFRATTTQPQNLLTWQPGKTSNYFISLSTLQSSIGRETKGMVVEGKAVTALFKDAPNGDFQLVSGSTAVNKGEALPTDIAAALGVAAGSPVNVGALSWKAGSSNTVATSTPIAVTPPAPAPNVAPKASVVLSGTSFTAPAAFQVTAAASDSDGTITKLEILQNGAPVHACYNTTTCRYDANGYGVGSVTYAARASDSASPVATTTSATQKLTVSEPTPVGLTAPVGISPAFSQNWFEFRLGLNWTPVQGATSYTVNRTGSSRTDTVTQPSYLDADAATLGYQYTYSVTAVNGTQKSPITSVKTSVSCGFWVFNCSATIIK